VRGSKLERRGLRNLKVIRSFMLSHHKTLPVLRECSISGHAMLVRQNLSVSSLWRACGTAVVARQSPS
jgi:hypothetical protein